MNFLGYPSGTKFWLGGNELASLGTWVWSADGSRVGPYTNWAAGQPDPKGRKHCLVATLPSLVWEANQCTDWESGSGGKPGAGETEEEGHNYVFIGQRGRHAGAWGK